MGISSGARPSKGSARLPLLREAGNNLADVETKW